jgi:hypothetical protein
LADNKHIFPGEIEIPDSFTTIYQTLYKKVLFDEKSKTILTLWNEQSAHISEEEYKKDALYTTQLILKSKALHLLADNRENKFPITPEIQRWYIESISTMFSNHQGNKCALLVNENLLLHQVFDETSTKAANFANTPKVEIRFFTRFDEAYRWLSK